MCEVLDRIENRGIEKGIERGIEQGIERGIEQGIERGIEQGIEQGIEALILGYIEDGFDREKIVTKLVKWFGLDEAAAEAYYEKYAFQAV